MMNSQHDKRFRPKFSVRTLVIVVTLICCYAACWGPTKTRGVQDVIHYLDQGTIPQFHMTRIVWGESGTTPLLVGVNVNETRYYYLWLFGGIVKLPFEGRADYKDMWGSWNLDAGVLRSIRDL